MHHIDQKHLRSSNGLAMIDSSASFAEVRTNSTAPTRGKGMDVPKVPTKDKRPKFRTEGPLKGGGCGVGGTDSSRVLVVGFRCLLMLHADYYRVPTIIVLE